MSCVEDLAATNEAIRQYQAGLLQYYSQAANLRAANESLRSQLAGRAASSPTTAAPATRSAVQVQAEQRSVGSGELAQYAALAREIADMEKRLDRLEAR